jgi:hypothetical protein
MAGAAGEVRHAPSDDFRQSLPAVHDFSDPWVETKHRDKASGGEQK